MAFSCQKEGMKREGSQQWRQPDSPVPLLMRHGRGGREETEVTPLPSSSLLDAHDAWLYSLCSNFCWSLIHKAAHGKASNRFSAIG